jgi:hypothetical protein
MERRLPRLAGMLRLAALAVLAVVLVMRLGPICEAVANASPVASEMTGCEGKPKPGKAPQQAACSTPCTAVQTGALAPVDAAPPVRMAFRPLPVVGLAGMPIPPATPPPRTV